MTQAHEKPTYQELEAENARLREDVKRLLRRIEELERSRKRQAAPFRRDTDEAKPEPRKPGRHSGKGKWCNATPPEHVDETLEGPLPTASPCCGAAVRATEVVQQHQIDLPEVRPHVRCFEIHVGCCVECGSRVQGRHELQTSDALGAAAVQMGPGVIALAASLNKEHGMSWRRIARFMEQAFGVKASPATYCRAVVERLAERAKPLYEQLKDDVMESAVVTADETGWRIAGENAWLWILTTLNTTVYAIERSRGWEVPAEVLGPDWSGTLVRDGWASYRSFEEASHQSCIAHLLRRAKGILKTAQGDDAHFANEVVSVLKKALDLRDRRDDYSGHGFAVRAGQIAAELDRLLESATTDYEPNRLFAKHLGNERHALFTFLADPDVDATNWRAETGIRGMGVINRKLSAGNRTDRGAEAQGVLMSVLRTCAQRCVDSIKVFGDLLRGAPVNLSTTD